MAKKGQITIFIIMGIIILLSVVLLFYLESRTKKEEEVKKILEKPSGITSVNDFVDSCVKDAALLGVYFLASQGGYIYSFDKIFLGENEQIAYHLEFENNVSPQKDFMERELSRFVKASLLLCLGDFEEFVDYQFELGGINVSTTIGNETVFIEVYFPITVIQSNERTVISEFNTNLPVRLGHILDVKDSILSMLNGTDLIDLNNLSSYDLEVNVLPYDKHNFVYSIIDKKSSIKDVPFIFNFGVKVVGNVAPRLDFIPDFVLTKGKWFVYDVNATDPDSSTLYFYSDNSLISVDSATGILSFTPQSAGTFSINVCVEDNLGARDCDSIKIMVKNE